MTETRKRGPTEDPLRGWRLAGLVATILIVLSFPAYLLRRELEDRVAADPETPAATFVGRETCIPCHRQQYEAWVGSDHDLAMDTASEATVLGDFDDATLEHDGIATRFFRRDGRYFVNTEGPGGEMAEFEITHTFGHEPLQQYLIPFPGGRLQALSVAWDTERQRWFDLYPDQDIPADDWLHWTRNAQNWNGMCAECHSTHLQKRFDPESGSYETTFSEIDVSCEACHGPASAHVRWAEIEPMARPELEDYGLSVTTRDLDARALVELCAPCHSRRTEMGDYDHRSSELMDNLLPAVLEEGLYHPDGQILDEVYVYGSYLQSKMYRNGVSCKDCHDVHSGRLKQEGNDLCLQCHREADYDRYEHHFHQQEVDGRPSRAALCVSCHMPEQNYMVIDARADHSLRIPRPDLSLEIGVPNACGSSGCHDDKSVQWSADAYRDWYGRARKPHYGPTLQAGREGRPEALEQLVRLASDPLVSPMVRASSLALLDRYAGETAAEAFRRGLVDEEPLVRYTAVTRLPPRSPEQLVRELAPLLFDPVRVVRMQVASRLAAIPSSLMQPYQVEALTEARAEYEAAMRRSLDFAFAGHNLGNLYVELGDRARAESYYRQAVAVDELFYPAKMNLAVLLNGDGRNEEAARLLQEVVSAYPEMSDAAYSLGLLLAEMGRFEESAASLVRATTLAPKNGRAHYNLGLVLQRLGRPLEAEAPLRRAVELEPNNLGFLHALGDHYLRTGDAARAQAVAGRMLELAPDDRVANQLWSMAEALALQSP